MPTRVLREGILTSVRVNALGPHAELFYRRLMSVVDDFGRYYAHPALLRAACYPLRVDAVREADIPRWLTEVESAGLILLYAIDSKRYLEMIDFRQQIRSATSKYPAPNCLANAQQEIISYKANDLENHMAPSTSPSSTSSRGIPKGVFKIPEVQEVAAYCVERKNAVDPQTFVDHYTSNGWRVGRNPMKDWRASVRTWERNDFRIANGKASGKSKTDEAIVMELRKLQPPLNWGPFKLQQRFEEVGFDGMTEPERAKLVAAYRTAQYR